MFEHSTCFQRGLSKKVSVIFFLNVYTIENVIFTKD